MGTSYNYCTVIVFVSLTCGGEGQLVIAPLIGHTDIYLHLLQQGRVDL